MRSEACCVQLDEIFRALTQLLMRVAWAFDSQQLRDLLHTLSSSHSYHLSNIIQTEPSVVVLPPCVLMR